MTALTDTAEEASTMDPYYADEQVTLHLGDALEVLRGIPNASIDAVACDPPYALANLQPDIVIDALTHWITGNRAYIPAGRGGFMAMPWDSFVPPPAVWDECLRVLKPGGHLLAFAAPRTQDLMALSIRIAGFEIRDSIHWIFGSGMPKGQDIAKAIDKRRDDRPGILQVTAWLAAARDAAGWTNKRIDALFGTNGMGGLWTTQGVAAIVPSLEQWAAIRDAIGFDDTEILPLLEYLNGRKGEVGEAWSEREVVGEYARGTGDKFANLYGGFVGDGRITLTALEEAKRWEGWNTQLRPAHEPIILARKSTGFNTTVANVLAHGTGALNVGACRTQTVSAGPGTTPRSSNGGRRGSMAGDLDRVAYDGSAGRWPTNLVFSHAPECLDVGVRTVRGDSRAGQAAGSRPGGFGNVGADSGTDRPNGTLHGDATVPVFECAPGCPVARLDGQGGTSASGGAVSPSRFFPVFRYQAKAPAAERPKLADGTQHVSVKPLELMRWLVRLVTPTSVPTWECDDCGQTLRGVRGTVQPEAGRTGSMRPQMPTDPCRKGPEDPTHAVSDLREDSGRGAGEEILQRRLRRVRTPQAEELPNLWDGVPRQESPTEALPAPMRVRSGEASAEDVRTLRIDVSAVGQQDPVLLADLRITSGGGGQAEGANEDPEGLRVAVRARPSDVDEGRLPLGAPEGCGGVPGPAARAPRGGASQERREGRQPSREFGSSSEGSARPDSQAAPEADRVPALRRQDRSLGSCPTCGGHLTRHDRSGVVLDPFAGSGTSLEAAVLEGFHAIGIEREQPYADLCVQRLSKPLQPSLFGGLE